MMENIETAIYSFKESERLKIEEYLNEEKILFKEIDAYDKKFDIWLTQKIDTNGFRTADKANSIANLKEFIDYTGTELLPEVIAFDVIIHFIIDKLN